MPGMFAAIAVLVVLVDVVLVVLVEVVVVEVVVSDVVVVVSEVVVVVSNVVVDVVVVPRIIRRKFISIFSEYLRELLAYLWNWCLMSTMLMKCYL